MVDSVAGEAGTELPVFRTRCLAPVAEHSVVIRLRPTRLLAIGAAVLVAFLYWKPTHSYESTKQRLQARHAEVAELKAERAKLQHRIELAGTSTELIRQARHLGLVKPGERLFIVRGINTWRKNH